MKARHHAHRKILFTCGQFYSCHSTVRQAPSISFPPVESSSSLPGYQKARQDTLQDGGSSTPQLDMVDWLCAEELHVTFVCAYVNIGDLERVRNSTSWSEMKKLCETKNEGERPVCYSFRRLGTYLVLPTVIPEARLERKNPAVPAHPTLATRRRRSHSHQFFLLFLLKLGHVRFLRPLVNTR